MWIEFGFSSGCSCACVRCFVVSCGVGARREEEGVFMSFLFWVLSLGASLLVGGEYKVSICLRGVYLELEIEVRGSRWGGFVGERRS